jgi:cyanate permease
MAGLFNWLDAVDPWALLSVALFVLWLMERKAPAITNDQRQAERLYGYDMAVAHMRESQRLQEADR